MNVTFTTWRTLTVFADVFRYIKDKTSDLRLRVHYQTGKRTRLVSGGACDFVGGPSLTTLFFSIKYLNVDFFQIAVFAGAVSLEFHSI